MSLPVQELTVCWRDSRTKVGPARFVYGYEPAPVAGRPMVLFIHGYNNGRLVNQEAQVGVLAGLERVRPGSVADIIHVTWPAHITQQRWVSGAAYPWKVGTAQQSGIALGAKLLQMSERGPLRVRLVAHSLGCLVALAAAAELQDTDVVEDLVLLGAAVPEGMCRPGGPFAAPLATGREHVLYSPQDEVLGRAFDVGQFAASVIGRDQAHARGPAIGLRGGPAGRWRHERSPRSLPHTAYWHDASVLRAVAPYLHRPDVRTLGSRPLAAPVPRRAEQSVYRQPWRVSRARPRLD